MVVEERVNKNWKLINSGLSYQEFRTCGEVHAQIVHCFLVSVVKPNVELNVIGFNALNIIFRVVWRYILVKKINKRKIISKQYESNKKCPFYETYKNFLRINY